MPRFRPLMTIIEDTVETVATNPGARHHIILGAHCTPYYWLVGTGQANHSSCTDSIRICSWFDRSVRETRHPKKTPRRACGDGCASRRGSRRWGEAAAQTEAAVERIRAGLAAGLVPGGFRTRSSSRSAAARWKGADCRRARCWTPGRRDERKGEPDGVAR